jgi:SAM-dependent methyltransferase
MERVAGTYETWVYEWSEPQERHNQLVKLLGRLDMFLPTNLLDIGCGNGVLTKRITDYYKMDRAEGVDQLVGGVIENKCPGLVIKKCNLDEESLPYPSDSFDLIHLGETFEHLYKPDNCLREIKRLLSPFGLCIITTPNLGAWTSRVALLFGFQPYAVSVSTEHEELGKFGLKPGFHGQWGHIRVPTLRALKALLRLHGFEIVRIEGWEQGMAQVHVKNGLLTKVVGCTDKVLSRTFPSCASRLALVIKK